MVLIGLFSLFVTVPAFGSCSYRRLQRAPIPPCNSEQVWDTQYQRCLSVRANGPPDQPPWWDGPGWRLRSRGYNPGASVGD